MTEIYDAAMEVASAVRFAARSLRRAADPAKASAMQAYLKTDMPFYGVQKPARVGIAKELIAGWPPRDRAEYRALVESLWSQPHREEKYLALAVARGHRRFATLSSVPLYRRLIVDGAWWDLVDEIAIKLVGRVLLRQRDRLTPRIRTWIDHRDLWVRRSAIISQVGHKTATDEDLLYEACLKRAHETDFFIRKAIGWALRDYGWTAPDAVRTFVRENEAVLSPLSRREALKNL